MRPAAVVGDLVIRVPKAFFYGLDSAAIAAGANAVIAVVIAGLISIAVLFGLLKLVILSARKLRMKEPVQLATRSGDVAYWIGCMLGVYFLCSATLVSIKIPRLFEQPGALGAIGVTIWTAILCWSIGYSVRYVLGRSSLNF